LKMPGAFTSTIRGALWVGLLIHLGLAGCQSTRNAAEDLPAEPIAFIYWEGKPAKARSEAFAKASEPSENPSVRNDSEAAEALEKRAYLHGEQSMALAQSLNKHPGRLMLYWPRTGTLERVEAAPPHARPMAWSPDRKRLLFASSHRGGRVQLYEYHLDRKDLSSLTFGPKEHPLGDYDARGRLAIQQLEVSARTGRVIS
jgi:hypothetical protein